MLREFEEFVKKHNVYTADKSVVKILSRNDPKHAKAFRLLDYYWDMMHNRTPSWRRVSRLKARLCPYGVGRINPGDSETLKRKYRYLDTNLRHTGYVRQFWQWIALIDEANTRGCEIVVVYGPEQHYEVLWA